ncbi:methylenetetrahydrofolate reductase [Mesorhizobium sp. CO1-1-11]|uniref:methylenetetrahydrofolate reductase n=1 Tax=Mesorhizobium sp. CO1-1-11 TaxID=2876636 RepID=UPI001CCE2C52|nr:methylenetetrahydrofolate reductase [Mesorhizobium sp. CO1-1-11]MBZ9727186.1 methylenetetrahydrofolate reductase [Mesorhizobium sp. CO1-1-11]
MPELKHNLAPSRAPELGLIDRGVSIELAPAQAAGFNPLPDVFPPGSRVFLTHLAGKPVAVQVEAARRLKAAGFIPVPHLGARHFETARDFADLVEAHSRNGVSDALFVGGNPLFSTGPFLEAADLLIHPVLAASTIGTAFIGGYPEGHPAIAQDALADALQRKVAICLERELAPRLVSQFAFDGRMIADWAMDVQRAHPSLPIHLGLAGVTSLTKLLKFAMLCGVGPSLAALRRSGGGLFNVLADKNPGDLIEAIETRYPAGHPQLFAHFFPFGGWEKSLAWLSDYRHIRLGRAAG